MIFDARYLSVVWEETAANWTWLIELLVLNSSRKISRILLLSFLFKDASPFHCVELNSILWCQVEFNFDQTHSGAEIEAQQNTKWSRRYLMSVSQPYLIERRMNRCVGHVSKERRSTFSFRMGIKKSRVEKVGKSLISNRKLSLISILINYQQLFLIARNRFSALLIQGNLLERSPPPLAVPKKH